jgi:methionine aminotransferase
MQITSKLPDVGLTIFTTMSKMAVDYQAINLGQGFPDFNTDPKLQAFVSKAMADGFNQYPYMTGIAELRHVIGEKVESLYGKKYNIDTEITVTSGATQAIMAILLASVSTGDEVIVLEPCYDCYLPAIKLAGAKAVCIPMQAPTQERLTFHVDWKSVQSKITTHTKMIIVNFPHNPTGAVMSKNDLDQLELVTQNTNIMILSDEVYEHIIFDNVPHLSVATRPGLAERSFVVSSFGKTTHTTGWKIGYVCAPKEMTVELRKIHQFMVFTVPSVLQHGLAAYTKDASTYLNLPAFYQKKRDRLANGLSQTKFRVLPSPGTFFLLADYSDISDASETEFSIWLTKEHGVTVIPVSAFYAAPAEFASNHKVVRFCFAKKEETLDRAVERLLKI